MKQSNRRKEREKVLSMLRKVDDSGAEKPEQVSAAMNAFARPGANSIQISKRWQFMVLVPLAGQHVGFVAIWQGAIVRAWGRPVGLA